MLILSGSPALSAFRKEKLLESLTGISAISARYVHFVALKSPLSNEQQQVLEEDSEKGFVAVMRQTLFSFGPFFTLPCRIPDTLEPTRTLGCLTLIISGLPARP